MGILQTEINKFVTRNSPQGLEKLAIECRVSRATLEKARGGELPKRDSTLDKICEVLKVQKELVLAEN